MGVLGEYMSKKMGVDALNNELRRLITAYNKIRNTYLIIYAGAIWKPIPDLPLCMDDYYIIFDILKDIDTQKLDFYIETPGGSGTAAEEIVRFLRTKFDHITFVVSGEAKSAGTIITLSGNEILMTESGSLGPIDAQVRIGRSTISAYDYMEWVKEKRVEAEDKRKLNPFDATMVAQISPGELEGVNNSLEFAKDLVVDWLSKYKFKDWNVTETRGIKVTNEKKQERAAEIAEALTNHGKWRSHGRSIKIGDLEGIGLKITRVDNEPELADIIYRIQTVLRLLFMSASTYKIIATYNVKITKDAIPTNALRKVPKPAPDSEANINPSVVEFEVKCQKCGEVHRLYAKLDDNPNVDDEMQGKGIKPFPSKNKLICNCGFEMDLSGIKNDIEIKIGKEIIN